MRRGRVVPLVAGLLVATLAVSPPVDRFADRSLTGHMLQHVLLIGIAPLLIVLGEPVRLALDLLPARRGRALIRALRLPPLRLLTHPLTTLALFSGVVLATHLPAVYEAALSDDAVHAGEHSAYLMAGILLWSAILGADPTRAPLPPVSVVGLITGAMAPMLVVGVAIAAAGHVVYPAYAAHGSAAGALAEQDTAATLMWAGDTPLAAAIVVVGWASLQREERRQRAREGRA